MAGLKLTLRLKEIPVELETEEGVTETYVIKELTGKERDTFLTSMGTRIRYNGKGEPSGLKNFDGVQASLLSLCLCDAQGEKVPEKTIQMFPATAQNEMFKAARELSALGEDSEDTEKKSDG